MGAKHKISGFFTAVILAVISFLVIYFFCPKFAEKSLGMSFKNGKVETVPEEPEDLKAKTEKVLDSMLEKGKSLTDKWSDTISEKVTDDLKDKVFDTISDTKDGLSKLLGK